VLVVATVGFFAPYFFFAQIASGRGAWFAGALFGLPFSAMLIYVVAIWCGFGAQRAREFIFYFELKQKMSVYVFYILGAPLSLLGFISVLALWR
jgi:hypothetical protein